MLLVIYIGFSDVETPAAVGNDRNFIAVRIFHHFRLFQKCMRMPAYHHIYILQSGDQFRISEGFSLIPEMGKAYHQITVFFFFQYFRIPVCAFHRIQISDLVRNMLVHHNGKVGQQTYDAYFHAAPAQDTIRLHDFLQSRIVKIIVGTDYRKPAPAYPARQFVQTLVPSVTMERPLRASSSFDTRAA